MTCARCLPLGHRTDFSGRHLWSDAELSFRMHTWMLLFRAATPQPHRRQGDCRNLLSATAEPGALSAPAPQRGEVPPGRSFTAAGLSVLLPPSLGPGPRTTRGQSSQTCTLLPNHAAPGLLPSAGRGRDALGLDNSEGALLPTEPLTDPRLDSRPVRIDATRTAYSGYPLPHQPSPEASTVCFVPPRAQPVTRDSRNRATRARHMKRVRSPYMQPLEEERPNFHIKCGNTRTASRTPETYTIFQLGLMDQDAGTASSIHREPGPCTKPVQLYSCKHFITKTSNY